MAFTVEQGGKHSAIGCEHDPFKESFLPGHSSLNKNATVQAADCFVHSAALEPSNKLRASSPFSLGMSYQQVQDTHDGRGVAGGDSTPDVAPCTPCPSFLQQKSQGQKITKMAHALPSLCLGIGLLEGKQVPCIQRLTTPEKPTSSSKEPLQQLSASSPQSIFITPIQGHEARSELQRETLEPFKELLISSKLCKLEKYPQESPGPHPVLSLGNFTEMPALQESPASSRNLRFSFLGALTTGDTQFAQETDFARLPLSSSECPKSFESGFASLNQFLDQCKSSTPAYEKRLHWETSQEKNPGGFVANTDALVNSLPSAVCTISCPPIVKQGWSKTLKQFPHLYQALSQSKNVAMSVCNERKSPEKRCKLLSSQENLASGASDKWSELNVASSGLPYNATRQKAQNFEQLNAREALEVASSRKTSDWHGQPLEKSFRPVNLAKVKVEIEYEESYAGQYTCGDSVEENDEIGRCNGKPFTEMGFLDSPSAAMYAPLKSSLLDMEGTLQQAGSNLLRNSVCAQLPQVLSTVSAGGPSLCFQNEQCQKHLEEQTPPMNRTSQIDGCWGKFLALSANAGRDTMKADSEIILPFQRRFRHLQEFLKQCDTSDKYSLQAFQSLSAAAMSGSAVELETRAVRLSLEEGKEMKRMKLLNVFGKASEGLHASSSGAVYGPRLPTLGNIVPVKQEI